MAGTTGSAPRADGLAAGAGGEADGRRQTLRRRDVVQATLAGLGGLAASPLLPGLLGRAHAAPSDPDAGPPVTPDPIRAAVDKSGIAVELVRLGRQVRATNSSAPRALLNFLYHAGDGSGRVFVNDTRGKLWRMNPPTTGRTLILDLATVRGSDLLLDPTTKQMGFRSFAFHPDFARPGQPGHRKLYTVSTETAGSAAAGVPVLGGPPLPVEFHDVVAEWTVDPADRFKVDPGSRREVLRIAMHKRGHGTDQLMFDPHPTPGTAGYGKMFVGVGDGGYYFEGDPYDQAQDPSRPLGKILRIDPLRRTGGRSYAVPADNPFVGKAGHLPEVWAMGLRHPQNICFAPDVPGTFLIADIGQHSIEEINLGVKGANYGWPLREGAFVTDRTDGRTLYALPPDDAAKGFAYPAAQYDHSEGRAIAGGFVYRGSAVPKLFGHYVCGDIVSGRVFHLPVSQLRAGGGAAVKELTLLSGGRPTTLLALVGPSEPRNRVDLRFGQDEAGEVYVLTKQDGQIRRMLAAANVA